MTGWANDEWRRERGVPTGRWFDYEDRTPITREGPEVADRLFALMLLPVVTARRSRLRLEHALEWHTEHGLQPAFTPREIEWTRSPAGEVPASWSMEAAWALAWCLGWTSEFGPFLQGHYSDWFFENVFDADPASRRRDAVVRDHGEVWDAFDLTVCVHWALRRNSPIEGVDTGVVVERQRALAWLVDDEETDWDLVTLDT